MSVNHENPVNPKLMEVQDQITRSNKTPKRKITYLIFGKDDQHEEQSTKMGARILNFATQSNGIGLSQRPLVSFRHLISDTQLSQPSN